MEELEERVRAAPKSRFVKRGVRERGVWYSYKKRNAEPKTPVKKVKPRDQKGRTMGKNLKEGLNLATSPSLKVTNPFRQGGYPNP